MLARKLLHLLLLFLLPSIFLQGAEDDDEFEGIRFRFGYQSQLFKRSGTAPSTDASDHGHGSMSEAEFKKAQQAVVEFWKERRKSGKPITKADVVELYGRAKDFKVVHSLLGNEISIEESRSIGRLRQEIHGEVLDTLYRSKQFGTRLGVNDFGSGADMSKVDAKTDIDFTLYSDNNGVRGSAMVQAYLAEFRRVTGAYGRSIDPGQCDIVAHKFEATIPDWRANTGLSDFTVRLRTGLSLLKANPEAYFLEGAYHQQVMGRSVDPKAKTFMWYSDGPDGKLVKSPMNAAKVPRFFYHPEFGKRYAWGGSVGNWHFFHAHGDDKAAQAKYLLRSIDNGSGLMIEGKTAEFEKMSLQDRKRLIRRIYGAGFDGDTLARIEAVMETAVKLRRLKSAKTLDMGTDEGKVRAYKPLIDQIRKEHGSVEVSDAELLKMAEDSFAKDGNRLLVQNNIETAETRLGDWLAPELKPGGKLHTVDENGNYKVIDVDRAMVERLQYSAFFEIRDGLDLMPKKMRDKIKKSNPRYARDIEILEGVIKKQKELMRIPEDADPDSAIINRQQLAQDMVKDYQALRAHFAAKNYSSGVWATTKTLWARGNQLEEWFKQATVRRLLVTAGGKKYVPHLHALFNSVQATNERYMGPIWMSRIDKGTSLLNVLKTYVKEGEINDTVIWTAVYEGMSYVPGVSVLYAVHGGFQGVATLSFVSLIPGYGQILLVLNFAKSGVELAGYAIFEPLRRDKVLMAYQGYLDPHPGGLIHGGLKERQDSPRPPLLLPVDPEGKLPMDQRREGIYHYFHDRIVADMKQLPSVWYEEHELPKEWREKEFEVLRIRARQHVNDWWNGIGVFDGYDVLTVNPSFDIRAELEQQLIQDYVKGKNIDLQKRIEAREVQEKALLDLYAQIAGVDVELDAEQRRLFAQYLQNGGLVEAFCLDGMPTIEPSIEIIMAPRIEEVDIWGKEKETEDIIEEVNLRAKVYASFQEHPGPWNIKWEMKASGAEKQSFELGQKEEIEANRGSVEVTATAYDAEGKKIVSTTVTLNVDKTDIDKREDEEDEDGESQAESNLDDARDIRDQMLVEQGTATDQTGEAKEKCQSAQEKAGQAEKAIEQLNQWLSKGDSSVSTVESELKKIASAVKDIEKDRKLLKEPGEKIAEARSEAGQQALEVCQMAQKIVNAKDQDERKEALEKAHEIVGKQFEEAKKEIEKLRDYAKAVQKAKESIVELRESLQEAQTKLNDLGDSASKTEQELDQAGSEKDTASTRVTQAKSTDGRTAELLSKGEEILDKIPAENEEAKELRTEMKQIYAGVKELVKLVDDCPEETVKVLDPVQGDFNKFEEAKTKLQKRLDKVAEELASKGYEQTLVEIWDELDAAVFLAELFYEDIQARVKDAELCLSLAKTNVSAPIAVTVPDLQGKTAEEVLEALGALGLNVAWEGGDPAPGPDKEFKVATQSPQAGERVEVDSTVSVKVYGKFPREVLVEVPKVTGMNREDAQSALSKVGLSASFSDGDEAPSEAKSKKVQSQNPSAGEKVKEESSVSVRLYKKYVKKYKLGSYRGRNIEEIAGMLRAEGIAVSVIQEERAEEAEDASKITQQSPGPGTEIRVGEDAVTLTGYKDEGEEYFVIARFYWPKIPESKKKKSKDEEEEKISTRLRRLNSSTMTLEPSKDVTIFHVTGKALEYYPIEFFQQSKQVACPIIWNLTAHGDEKNPSRSVKLQGAFLYGIDAVLKDPSQLKRYGASAENIGKEGELGKYLKLKKADGTFFASHRSETNSGDITGGPFEQGWSSTRRRENLNLYIKIFEFMGCFIASSIYENPFDEQLSVLRDFRGRALMQSKLGRKLVRKYYRLGPIYAAYLKDHPRAQAFVKQLLDKTAKLSENYDAENPVHQMILDGLLQAIDCLWLDDRCSEEDYPKVALP